MIGIINTNFANIGAIKNIYSEIGIECVSITNIDQFENVNKLIIPGIGNFDNVINSLKKNNLYNFINDLVIEKKIPILGICIGMHLFYNSSEEGNQKGFGWIDAEIEKMNVAEMKYPHMGWNSNHIIKENPLFKDIENESFFYFLHSYGNKLDRNSNHVLTSSYYGEEFVSSIRIDNIYGVQFHPEKSHSAGIKLLSNFAKNCA